MALFCGAYWAGSVLFPWEALERAVAALPAGPGELVANLLFRWGAAPTALLLVLIATLWRVPSSAMFLEPRSGCATLSSQLGIGTLVGIGCAIPVLIGMSIGSEHHVVPTFVPWAMAGNCFSDFYKEFIFRGFLLGGLIHYDLDRTSALLISASLSALSHFLASPLELSGAFIISLLWGIMTLRCRSLLPAYIAHLCVDMALMQLRGIII